MEAHARDLQQVTRLVELLGDQCTLAHLHWREAHTPQATLWLAEMLVGLCFLVLAGDLSAPSVNRLAPGQGWRDSDSLFIQCFRH